MPRLLALLGVGLALTTAAQAQGPAPSAAQSTLLIVRTRGDQDVVRRIEAELRASAFSVVHLGPDAELESAPLRELAGAQGATAALRFDAADAELELWVASVEPAAEGHTELLSATGAGEQVLALRVVETLRARELALERAPDASAPAPEQPKPEPAEPEEEAAAAPSDAEEEAGRSVADEEPVPSDPPAPPLPRVYPGVWLELAPALTYSPGGLGPTFDGWLGLRLQPAATWSVSGFMLAPIWSERVEGLEGSARVSILLFGVGALAHLIRSPFELHVGAGLHAALGFTSGDAREPYASSDDTVFAPGPFATASLHVPLGGGFRACARTLAGITLPGFTVRFGRRDAAQWGRPFAAVTLGFELALAGQ